jgi:hypothetical protein
MLASPVVAALCCAGNGITLVLVLLHCHICFVCTGYLISIRYIFFSAKQETYPGLYMTMVHFYVRALI